MSATIIDGTAIAAAVRAEVAEGVRRLLETTSVRPKLLAVLAGDDPASHLYVSSKRKAAAEVGIESDSVHLPASAGEQELVERIDELSGDPSVHGILLQLPLPGHVDARRVLDCISPEKDVDGLHPVSIGRLCLDVPGFVPCTPAGILELLRRSGVQLAGAEAVVVGRSHLVGRPLLQLLLREHCTVTVCHSRTRNLAAVTSRADVLVAAMGRPAAIGAEHIREGAVVIDVGTNVVSAERAPEHFRTPGSRTARLLEKNGKVLVGDVDPFAVGQRAGAYTPVPGGVGPMTIAMLLRNTLLAAEQAAGRGQ
jgi:methylenetetrahydrofolate dehydrogenase (NADP+) / methenyltetrahydrofolate cyclohydrolase